MSGVAVYAMGMQRSQPKVGPRIDSTRAAGSPPSSLSPCGGCGETARRGEPHRRGRCKRCYDRWVRSKPVGLGAACLACNERRTAALRQFELHRSWVVLCQNCSVRAEKLALRAPLPRSLAGLRLLLLRDRRHGDRRAEAVGTTRKARPGSERRDADRRLGLRDAVDLTDDVQMESEPAGDDLVELVADFAGRNETCDPDDVPITDVHWLVDTVALDGVD